MSQLSELTEYKNKLMEDLLTNENIVKLIDSKKTLKTAKSLAYTCVYPYELITETFDTGKTYICFEVELQSIENSTYYYPTIYIWLFSHTSLLRLPNGEGVRTDRLCQEIAEQINGSMYYGLGSLELKSVRRFAPQTDFNGKLMIFTAKDFNHLYDGKKSIPTNRKRG